MIRALCVLALAAGAFAAPHYGHHHRDYVHNHEPIYHRSSPFGAYHPSEAFETDMFDTGRFWNDISREMLALEQMMQDLHRRFPITTCSEEFEEGKYKLTIPLPGFEEGEITVKAKDTVLMVQAIHDGDQKKTYIDARTLPSNVDPKGIWTYDGKVLIITFPVTQTTTSAENEQIPERADGNEKTPEDDIYNGEAENSDKDTQQSTETESNNAVSREEMDPHQTVDNKDADVGLKNTYNIKTNHISTPTPVHATTYAVDVNNEVEFVPIRY